MRTTVVIDDDLLDEAERLSGCKTKKKTIEAALVEFIKRRKAARLLDFEGKMDLAFTLPELLELRKKDVPD
jgi:Arc/MetJ family transcription regulator